MEEIKKIGEEAEIRFKLWNLNIPRNEWPAYKNVIKHVAARFYLDAQEKIKQNIQAIDNRAACFYTI